MDSAQRTYTVYRSDTLPGYPIRTRDTVLHTGKPWKEATRLAEDLQRTLDAAEPFPGHARMRRPIASRQLELNTDLRNQAPSTKNQEQPDPMSKAPKTPPTLDEIHQGRTNIFRIPAKYVLPALLEDGTRLNVRDNFGTEEERHDFARSIAEHGIKQPLLGTFKDGVFYYDDGDRRMDGHKLAVEHYGLKGEKALVPIRRQEKGTTDEARTMDLLTLNSGRGLNMFEQAKAMLRLTEKYGKTPDVIARANGCSITHVKSCIDLLTQSCDGVRAAVAAGKLAATTAADFVHEVPSIERQEELLAQARAAAEAAGTDKITARHFPILLGKKAQESRREPTPAPTPSPAAASTTETSVAGILPLSSPSGEAADNSESKIQNSSLVFHPWSSLDQHQLDVIMLTHSDEPESERAKYEYAFENGDIVARRQHYPESGGRQDTDPFEGKDASPTSAQTNDRGEFISGIVNRPVTFSTAAGVSAAVGLALRNSEWFMGVVLKWPGTKDDNSLKIAPTLKGKAYESGHNQLAEIDGVQLIRSELEAREFKSKRDALADLDRHLTALVRGLSPDLAKLYTGTKVTPLETTGTGGEPSTRNQAPGTSTSSLPNPVIKDAVAILAELKQLIDEIPASDAEKDRLKTIKYVHGWLAGKLQRTDLAKYILGVTDKVEATKKP